MKKEINFRRFFAIGCAALLILAGSCGGDDEGNNTDDYGTEVSENNGGTEAGSNSSEAETANIIPEGTELSKDFKILTFGLAQTTTRYGTGNLKIKDNNFQLTINDYIYEWDEGRPPRVFSGVTVEGTCSFKQIPKTDDIPGRTDVSFDKVTKFTPEKFTYSYAYDYSGRKYDFLWTHTLWTDGKTSGGFNIAEDGHWNQMYIQIPVHFLKEVSPYTTEYGDEFENKQYDGGLELTVTFE